MENPQQVPGEEQRKKGNQPGTMDPSIPGKDDPGVEFESEGEESEINPSKFDRKEIDLDRTGKDQSKGHEPYEFTNQQGGDRGLNEGSNSSGQSGGAGGAQFGPGANPLPGESLRSQGQRNGIGGGSDNAKEEKKERGSETAADKSSSQGMSDNSLRGSSGGVDGQKSGKGYPGGV